ncbi:Gamma-soluble NSF attachment protein [Acipenser ruthenus]|uniref:Gamma-soluble NSF attachment protein n=1 Tax=Acipenser ruthenus TaxID=7906 RepID=A0A444U6U3_ACIRT|nr:Gamma-soluble NSF attachment protein [Acipenser ruthenus]
MKWKPDYDSAASEYAKAAVAFKNAKQLDQAKEAYLSEAQAHTDNRAAIEQAGMMLKEMQRMPEAIQYIEKASMMYVENGTPDTAAMALDRAGKLIEPVNLEKAVELYQQAASVFENEDRLRQAVELLGKASRLLVRARRFDEAAASIQKEKDIYKEIENYPTCFKVNIPGFNSSEDCGAMEKLLEGYDQQDEDQVYSVCNSPLVKYMDNDYAKLALSLKVPGGGTKKKSPETPKNGAGGSRVEQEDDEYSGGLC